MGLNPKSPLKNKPSTVNPLSVEGIDELVNSAPERKLILQGRKYAPTSAGTGVVTLGEGIDTDQLQQLAGNGGTLSSSTLEAAGNVVSQRQKEQNAIAQYKLKEAQDKANRLAQIEADPFKKKLKESIAKKTGSEEEASDKVIEFEDKQKELDKLEGTTLWERIKSSAAEGYKSTLGGVGAVKKEQVKGMTPAQEKIYKELQTYKKVQIEPALKDLDDENKSRYQYALAKAEELKQAKLRDDARPVLYPDGTSGPKANSGDGLFDSYSPTAEETYWRTVASKYEDINEKISDYRTGNTDFFAGISTTSKDNFSLGLKSVRDDFRGKEVFDKLNRIQAAKKKGLKPTETITEAENAIAEVYHKEQEVAKLKLHDNHFWYNTGIGVGGSASFMAQLLLTRGAGSLAKKGVTAAIRGGLEEAVKEEMEIGLRGLLKQSIKKGTLASLSTAGREIGERGLAAGTGLLVQAPLSPMFYKAYASDQIGNIEKVVKNGKERFIVKDELYEMKSPYYKDQLKSLDELIKLEKNPEKKDNLEGKRNALQAEWDSFIPKSEASSLGYATGEFLKEAFSEEYVGRGLGAATELSGKGLRAGANMISPKAGVLFDKAGNLLSKANTPFRKLTNAVNNLTLGRVSFDKIGRESGEGLIQSIPEETFEEIFAQAVPAFNQTYAQYKENVKELGKASFYRDVMAQTAIMGGTFQSLGAIGRARAYSKDKTNYSKMLSDLKNIDISKDEEKALALASGHKLASPVDYRILSGMLREAGNNKAADQLEQRMFINMAQQAARVGGMGSYKEAVDQLTNRKDIPQSFKQNALMVAGQVEAIHKAHQEHSSKENFQSILDATVYVGIHEDNLKKLKEQLPTLQEQARGEVEAFKTRTGKQFDFSPETVLTKEHESEEAKAQYLEVLNSLLDPNKEGNIAVQNLVAQVNMIRGLEVDIAENKKIINDELSPVKQEELKAKKALREEFDLLSEEVDKGKITLPGLKEGEQADTIEKTKAIIMHLEDTYGHMISKEHLQELKKLKFDEAEAQKREAVKDLSVKRTQQIEDEKIPQQAGVDEPTTEIEENPDFSFLGSELNPEGYEDDKELPTTAINESEELDAAFGIALQGFSADSPVVEGPQNVITKTPETHIPAAEDPLYFEGEPMIGKVYDPGFLKQIQDTLVATTDMYEQKTGNRITFKAMFEYFNSKGSAQAVQKNFGAMMSGWIALNEIHGDNMYPLEDFIGTYMDIYTPMASFDIFETLDPQDKTIIAPVAPVQVTLPVQAPSIEVVKENENLQQKALLSSRVVGQDDSNRTITEEVPEIIVETQRTSNVLPKMGYASLEYKEVSEDGVYRKVSIPVLNVNKSNGINIAPLLDPNGIQTGDTVGVEMSSEEEWKNTTVSNGRDSEGRTQLTTFDAWVAERESNNPDFRNTDEFINKVPVYYTVDGKRVSAVHDTDWYSGYNVEDPMGLNINPHRPTGEWANEIQKGKEGAQKLRQAIVKGGLKEAKVVKSPTSVFEVSGDRGLVSLDTNNPQSILAVQMGEKIFIGNKQEFKAGVIVNEADFLERNVNGKLKYNSNTWEIRREGKKQLPNGTWVDTYRAFHIQRKVTKQQLETVKWALAANAVKNKFTSYLGTPTAWTSMTETQASNIREQVLNHTGLDIFDPVDIMTFVESFLQLTGKPDKGQLAYYQKNLIKDNLGMDFELTQGEEKSKVGFVQHSKESLLHKGDFKSAVHIINGQVQPLNMNYHDYLKNTLKTNVLSFNIGTEDKPIYVTNIQPIINIVYSPVETISPTNEADKVLEATEQTTEEVPNFISEEQYNFAASLGIDIDSYQDYEDGEAMIANDIETLHSLLISVAGLTTPQEQDLRQVVTHAIASVRQYVDEEGRIFNKKGKVIEEETKVELFEKLNRVKKAIQVNLSIVTNSPGESSEKKAFIKAYTDTITNINSVQDNYKELFKRAVVDFEKQSKTELDDSEEVEDALNEKNYNKDSVEENSKLSVGTILRNFLYGVQKRDSKGTVQTGYLGLPKYYTFNEIFNELTKVLSLGYDLPSSYDELIKKLQYSEVPFTKDILIKLKNADQQTKNQFLYTFVKHSMTSNFTMYQEVNGLSELKSYETNANEATRVIEDKWKNNNRTSALYKRNLTINETVAGELIDTYEKWLKGEDSTPANHRAWLSKLGINFTEAAWDKIVAEGIKDKGYSYNNLLFDNKQGIFLPIVNFLKAAKLAPTVYTHNEEKNIFKELSGMFKSLAKIEAIYNTNLVSLTYRDGDKTIFTQTPETFMSDRVGDLLNSVAHEDNSLIEDLQSLSYSENSIILNFLKRTGSNFKDIFKVSHAAIVTLKERGEEAERAGITDLGEIDYDLNVNGQFGDRKIKQLNTSEKISGIHTRIMRMLSPTMSDKSKAYYLDTVGLDLLRGEELIDAGFGEIKMSDRLKGVLIEQLIMPEVKRIMNYHARVNQTNIKDYDKGAQIFHLIPALNSLTNEDGLSILDELANVPNLTPEIVLTSYNRQFTEIITKVIEAEVRAKQSLWAEHYTEGVGSKMFSKTYFTEVKKDPAKDYNKAIYDVVINGMLHNSEMFKVFAGDMAMYSQNKVFKKEFLSNYTTEDWLAINKAIGVNLGKRLAALAAPGNKIADSADPKFRKYNQIFLTDSKDIAPNSEYLIALHYGKEALTPAIAKVLSDYSIDAGLVHQYEIGNTVDMQAVEQAKVNMVVARERLTSAFPVIADYFDIEATDAQEYTTVREHINVLNRQGRLTDAKLKAIEAKLETGEPLAREDLKVIMQPIKPVHTGSYVDKDLDVNRYVYIKSSSYPLLPEFTKGTKLDGLRIKMEELEKSTGRFTRASFQSANKVGATRTTINPFDKYSLEGIKEYAPGDVNAKVLTLDRNNFRIQQDVPVKSEKTKADKISMGTQFFKLLFGDGITEADGFVVDGKKMTGRELHTYYSEAFAELAKYKRTELFQELGLSPNGEIQNKKNFIYSLGKLLETEAVKRGYSLKSIAGLKIDELAMAAGVFYEFKTPLWLSSDKNRYESLLNSIVTNRLMQHKISGNAYVAGSESGIQFKEGLESLNDVDDRTKSRIIYLDNFNGKELGATSVTEEDGTPVFKKAQVFVRSYFKNPSTGELINLFEGYNSQTGDTSSAKYLIRRENGTLGLKEGMIDENLMNMFSFRTPTSSHVSGSSIEIAGILPPEMGELMIVPKNFTKQKGLDFDVDKENTYQLNHYLDSEGQIKEVNAEYVARIQDSLKELKFYKERDYETIAEIETELGNLQDKLSVATSIPYVNELLSEIEGLWAMTKATKVDIREINHTMKGIQRNLDTKVASQIAENKFIKSHLSVFNNPNSTVQSKINKVLSMQFAQDQAKMFEKAVEDGNKSTMIAMLVDLGMTLEDAEKQYITNQSYNTVLSYSYQKMKMDLGSIGKTAIGVYANYTTMNGLIQQQGVDVSLDSPITLGKLSSNGKLGVISSLKPSNITAAQWESIVRTTAEIFAEKENTATDNEKEQILGRVGVNDQTINVDSLMTLLGFDIDLVKVPGVAKKQKMSVSYLLLSQPSIRNYNKAIKNSRGLLADAFFDTKALKKSMIEELSGGLITFGKDKNLSSIDSKNIDTFRYVKTGGVYKSGSALTGQAMYEGIASQGSANPMVQVEALITFLELDRHSKNVAKAQKVLNTNELGKSLVESAVSYRALADLPDSPIKNVEKLLGEFEKNPNVITEDMYKIGSYYVTPTTPQGHITIHGLQAGNTLFRSFFPYDDVSINSVINEILTAQGKNPDTIADSTYIKEYHKIMEEMIKYINSNTNNNTYVGSAREKRQELFIDSDANTSLSTYLRDLGMATNNKRGVNSVLRNALYTRFSYKTGAEGELSLIKYNNTATDNLDEEVLYNAIPELILSNLPLPNRNGKPYSTRQLGEDLVAYSFLEGGVQEATQFSKFIPVQLLEVMGQLETRGDKEVFVPINRKLQMFNNRENSPTFFDKALGATENDIAAFTRQYFQNNPTKAKKAWSKNVKFTEGGDLTYETNQKVSPKFITYTSVQDGKKTTDLYENVGGKNYIKLDTVGQSGIKEYYYKQNQATSLFNTSNTINQKPVVKEESKILESVAIDTKSTPESLLEQIQNLSFEGERQYLAETAKWLLPLLKEGLVSINITNALPSGTAGHTSRPDSKGQIMISLSEDQLKTMSKEKGSEIIIHEILHSVAVSHLTEYFDNEGKNLREDVTIPAHVLSLMQAYSVARRTYETEVNELETKIAANKIVGGPRFEYTERELNVIYGLTNVFEFVSVAMTSEDFHNEFKNVPYLKSGKSVMDKIQDFIINMLDEIFPGLKEDTVAKASVLASMRFIQEERTKGTTKKIQQPTVPNANVGAVYGKNIEVPLNERIIRTYPDTIMGPQNNFSEGEMSTEVLLSIAEDDTTFSPNYSFTDFYDKEIDDYNVIKIEEKFGKKLADFLIHSASDKIGNVTYSDLENIKKAGTKGLAILDAYDTALYEQSIPSETTIQQFTKKLLDQNVNYIDKNQTKLFEEGENMISNILTNFGTPIQELGITQEEWDSLSLEEQDKIKKCN